MYLTIDEKVWEVLPGLRIVAVVAEGIDNTVEHAALGDALVRTQRELYDQWAYPNAQSHPRLAAWRMTFRCLGISNKKHTSSIEALCRRILSGRSLPHINPIVDFYNLVSISYKVPAGGWDLTDLASGRVHLSFTEGGEPFHELGTGKKTHASPGELAYCDGHEIITRHFVWRQSERGKISRSSRKVLLVSEILGHIEEGVETVVETALAEGIYDYFGVVPVTAVITAPKTNW